jgi:uncharacterized protein YuzE
VPSWDREHRDCHGAFGCTRNDKVGRFGWKLPRQPRTWNTVSRVKLSYYPDTDSLYIDLRDEASVDSREIAPGVVLDFTEAGTLVGIDIDRASEVLDLTTLETEAVPIAKPD